MCWQHLAKDVGEATIVLFLQNLETAFYLVSAYSEFPWQPRIHEGKIFFLTVGYSTAHLTKLVWSYLLA